jgi:DNA-binding Lrp family transcriptional regulator
LDEVDQKITSKLQLDGRTTFKELAELVGYTSMGVKKRFEGMQERGVLKVSALLNMESLNLIGAIVMIEIESAEAMNKLLERFRNCPRVVHIFTTLSGYNLIALIVAEDQSTLESISVEKCSLRSSEGIRRSELYPLGKIHYSPFLPVRKYLAHKERLITPCNVDCGPCQRYLSKECVGCPATRYYKGSL